MTSSTVCFAQEKINQTLLTSTTGTIFVDIPRGDIQIEGWDESKVVVKGELDDSTSKLIFKTKGENTLIKADLEGKGYRGDASQLTIVVPKQSKLRFKGIDTSFDISKLNNDIEGKTISGNLILRNIKGQLKVSVVSGNIKVADSSGVAKVKSVSGNLSFTGEFEEALLKSMSGNIHADISGTQKLAIKNVSGDTNVSGHVKNLAQISLSSVNGDIYYQAKGELNAQCQLVSQFGGEIDNQLTKKSAVETSLHKKTLSFISGDGSGTLILNTVTGSITIKKSKDK